MDRYAAALQAMSKQMPIEQRVKLTPEQMSISEDLGMAGIGSVDDISRGVKIAFPEGIDLKIRKAAKDKFPEMDEVSQLGKDPRLEKYFGELSIESALNNREILRQIKEAKENGYTNPFSRKPIDYQNEYNQIIEKLNRLLGIK